MKFTCACGATIVDQTDGLPHKAHLMADQDRHALADRVDDVIERSGPSPGEKQTACVAVRRFMSRVMWQAYECRHCGRLHIADGVHALHSYLPEDGEVARRIFASRRSSSS